ncbi:MAG: hypothetical protein IJT88_02735 [Kiritimatiellae bacterium]|nr:hypothetical protein [Kiritimatiellia bacterium]MBQ9344114.1 hypothetical protein [Kiritimatiellia bacterium]
MKRTLAYFFLFAFLLNAPALRTTADNLPFDHPLRPTLLKLLAPVATLSSATHLYDLRAALSRFELRHLE